MKAIRRKRLAIFGHWRDRAVALLPQSVEMISSTPDAQLRNYFFRDVPPGRTPRLGEVSHIALWKEMQEESRSKDRHLIASLLQGIPLLGAIHAGYDWEALDPRPDSFYSPDELAYRAWGTHQRVAENLVRRLSRTAPDMAAAVWDKTMADVSAGYCIGPLQSEMEVTALWGTADWIAMPRFPVSQANGARPIDDGSIGGSVGNLYGHMVEKLAVPNTDYAITVARALNLQVEGEQIGGWTVDEASAFRQLPILPSDRQVAVFAMCEPGSGAVKYFSMTGHPFGLTASVFNFCRRGLALADVFLRLFGVVIFGYVDDRFGLARLGVKTNNKVAYGPELDIIGVHFNFATGKLTPDRSRLSWKYAPLLRRILTPGQAAKLRGKLVFVSGHYKERHGRSQIKPIADPQHCGKRSLLAWLAILGSSADARSILGNVDQKPADFAIFTDGSHPEAWHGDKAAEDLPRVDGRRFGEAL